jgi:uncharacterized protein HemX
VLYASRVANNDKSSTSIILWVVGIIGCVGLLAVGLVFAGAGASIFMLGRSQQEAVRAAESQRSAIEEERTRAYEQAEEQRRVLAEEAQRAREDAERARQEAQNAADRAAQPNPSARPNPSAPDDDPLAGLEGL